MRSWMDCWSQLRPTKRSSRGSRVLVVFLATKTGLRYVCSLLPLGMAVSWVDGLGGVINVKLLDSILEIREILSRIRPKVGVRFVPRSSNAAVDFLVKQGAVNGLVQRWLGVKFVVAGCLMSGCLLASCGFLLLLCCFLAF
ncbi:hypothetical protein QYF36_007313 [Acer negundo]|nr:hypothetical protein QYF36_007313 [Acer negundo]